MTTATQRRMAYSIAADAISEHLRRDFGMTLDQLDNFRIGTVPIGPALKELHEKLFNAGSTKDEPEVALHVDGQPIVVGCNCADCTARRKSVDETKIPFKSSAQRELEIIAALREYDFDVLAAAVSMGAAPPDSPEAAAFRARIDSESAQTGVVPAPLPEPEPK